MRYLRLFRIILSHYAWSFDFGGTFHFACKLKAPAFFASSPPHLRSFRAVINLGAAALNHHILNAFLGASALKN